MFVFQTSVSYIQNHSYQEGKEENMANESIRLEPRSQNAQERPWNEGLNVEMVL